MVGISREEMDQDPVVIVVIIVGRLAISKLNVLK
jgi:hypothetical protein